MPLRQYFFLTNGHSLLVKLKNISEYARRRWYGAELGKRFKCYKCNCKFYDLGKPNPICPRCGEDQTNEENKKLLKRKRKRVIGKGRSDVRPEIEDNELLRVGEDDVEEYILDMEDIVLEENSEYEEEPAESEEEE